MGSKSVSKSAIGHLRPICLQETTIPTPFPSLIITACNFGNRKTAVVVQSSLDDSLSRCSIFNLFSNTWLPCNIFKQMHTRDQCKAFNWI